MHTAAQQGFARAVAVLRKRADLSRRELAAVPGREQSYVGQIETGQRRVDPAELVRLCLARGADPNHVIPGLARAIAGSVPRQRRRPR